MIKGKAKLEFGTGTIKMVPTKRDDGVVALCLTSCEPEEIGSLKPMDEGWTPAQSEVIFTFTNQSSIKSLIMELAECWRLMRGVYPNGYEDWRKSIDLDFDSFLEDAK